MGAKEVPNLQQNALKYAQQRIDTRKHLSDLGERFF